MLQFTRGVGESGVGVRGGWVSEEWMRGGRISGVGESWESRVSVTGGWVRGGG